MTRWTELPDELKSRVRKDGAFSEIESSVSVSKNKYNNKKTEIDGIKFDSKKESVFYEELKVRKMSGEIIDFEMQVPFELQPGYIRGGHKIRPIYYVADFVATYPDGHKEVIDVKGWRTEMYKLKKKILLYRYPELIFLEA